MNARRHALQDLSFVDFAARLTDDPVIVLPLGSHEQQGPHAPMGDFVVAERIALAAAERADAICAPVLPFGYAEFFRGFAGGMQLRGDSFRLVLRDMIHSFSDHGVRRIVIVNGHSTNATLIAEVTHQIRRETGLFVPNLNLWRMVPDSLWDGKGAAARGHGADPLTSVMLHLTPDLVRSDRISACARKTAFGLPTQSQFAGVDFDGAPVDLPLDASDVADNGIGSGDAVLASAQTGAAITTWLVDHVARFLTYWRTCDPSDPGGA